jgi:hypothetical protein
MPNLQSKDRTANPSYSELLFNFLATAVQVEADANKGQGDFPETNLAGQDNPNNDDAPLLKGFPLLFALGFLFFWIWGPLWVAPSVAWTFADPLATAFQVAVYQIMVFGCMMAWWPVVWTPFDHFFWKSGPLRFGGAHGIDECGSSRDCIPDRCI